MAIGERDVLKARREGGAEARPVNLAEIAEDAWFCAGDIDLKFGDDGVVVRAGGSKLRCRAAADKTVGEVS